MVLDSFVKPTIGCIDSSWGLLWQEIQEPLASKPWQSILPTRVWFCRTLDSVYWCSM